MYVLFSDLWTKILIDKLHPSHLDDAQNVHLTASCPCIKVLTKSKT